MGVIITANAQDTTKALQDLKKQIFNAMPGAINNSLRRVQDTINRDYRRFGNQSPSYLNPSRSGLGFTDRTGRLRSSIKYETSISFDKVEGILSANTEYAEFIESLWGGRYSFMFPAAMQEQDYIIDQIEQAVIRGVERAARL